MLLSIAFVVISALPPAQTASDEFVFNNQAEVETIDPSIATGQPDNNITMQIFEGLYTHKPDWVSLVPGQAESHKVQTKNGVTTYTFKLRPNLKWSDGTPLTAKDFEYSWLRAIRPSTLSQYSYWFTDNIVGAKEYAAKQSVETERAVGIKALDANTLEVKLNKPLPYFLYLVAEPIFYPVKKEVVEKHRDAWTRPENIVSNGAYKLTEWKVRDKMVLEKNTHYRDAASVKLKRIVALPIEDRQTGVNLFLQGKLDWSGHNGAPNSLVPNYRTNPNFRVHPAFVTYWYWINTTRAPLNDKRVRQALSLAVDREALVQKVTRGGEGAAHALVPPKTGTYISPKGLTSGNFQDDLKRAKALLAEAGFPNGKGLRPLVLQYNTDDNHKRIAQTLAYTWKKELGVEVQLLNMEWKVYLKSQTAKDFDLSRQAWVGDYPDPASFLELFLSDSGNNHSGLKLAAYDKLFQQANETTDLKKRADLLQQAEALMLDEVAAIPIYSYTNFSFLRPEVKGFEPNLSDRPFIKYYSKN